LDVLILGLGVAGSYAAWRIASSGFTVTAYDPVKSYRKACGDATPADALSGHLAAKLGVVLNEVRVFHIEVEGREIARVEFSSPAWYIIDKAGFVNTLRSMAVSEGARILYRPPDGGDSSILVDARGPYTGRDYMMLHRVIARTRWDPEVALIDFRPGEGGLYWIFPHGEHVNVGGGFISVGSLRETSSLVHAYASRMLGEYAVVDERGAPLAATRRPRVIGPEGEFRVGEAAGLVNSTSGEGIRQSIASSEALAVALSACGGEPGCTARAYSSSVRGLVVEALLSRLMLWIAGRPSGASVLERLPESFWRGYLLGKAGPMLLARVFAEKPGITTSILEALRS